MSECRTTRLTDADRLRNIRKQSAGDWWGDDGPFRFPEDAQFLLDKYTTALDVLDAWVKACPETCGQTDEIREDAVALVKERET